MVSKTRKNQINSYLYVKIRRGESIEFLGTGSLLIFEFLVGFVEILLTLTFLWNISTVVGLSTNCYNIPLNNTTHESFWIHIFWGAISVFRKNDCTDLGADNASKIIR